METMDTDSVPKTKPEKSGKAARKRQSLSHVAMLNTEYHGRELKSEFREAFTKRDSPYIHGNTKAVLETEPFVHCILPKFIKDSHFLDGLKDELLDQIFCEKNNDLYKFQQSDDLKKTSRPHIKALKRLLYYDFKEWLQEVTEIPLSDKVDMTCSKYDYTDTLLCHDDELEGRRIAFILYLVPTWREEDGGLLDLFNLDEHGQPKDVVKSVKPAWNTFTFFEVSPASFHQVAEVLTEDKTRLSVNGWFHGPPIVRPKPYIEPKAQLQSHIEIEEDLIYDWINPIYLEPEVQGQIQEKFENESEIELQGFLKDEKYQALIKALKSEEIQWVKQGPANKRCYFKSMRDNLPNELVQCMRLFQSESMFLILSNLTGLTLHQLAAKNASSDSENDDALVGPEDFESNCSENSETDLSKNVLSTCSAFAKSRQRSESDSDGLVDKSSAHRKKQKLNSEGASSSDLKESQEMDCSSNPVRSVQTNNELLDKTRTPQCRGEIQHWEHGCYTLIHDTDSEGFEFALDLMLFVSCKGWQQDFGGYASYIAKGEDEELLTVSPAENSLALVYRDKDTMKFVKHINHKVHQLSPGSTDFYNISYVYYE